MPIVIQLRRATASAWTTANITLAQGEVGLETDTDKMKIGDGSTAWNSLPYSTVVNGANSVGTLGASALSLVTNNTERVNISSAGAITMVGPTVLATGTTADAALSIPTGSLLTTATAGAIEFDGNSLYVAGDTTNGTGRGIIQAPQVGRVITGASVASGGAFFTASRRPALLAGHLYHFKYFLRYTKVTAGTVTYSFANSATTTLQLFANANIVLASSAAAVSANLYVLAAAASATTSTASASLTAAAHFSYIDGYVIPAANTRLQLNVTCSAGTVTSIADSNFVFTDLGSATTIGNIA